MQQMNSPCVISTAILAFSLITTAGPEEGWLGKVSALQTGFLAASADVVITIDADVRLEPDAIAQAVQSTQRPQP